MSSDRTAQITEWLAAEGRMRVDAVQRAASFLLQRYLDRWQHIVPVELHRLASTLTAEVVRLDTLGGDAVLMPVQGGFRILVNATVPVGRYRTSVAHELAHTLFYDVTDERVPRRRIPHTRCEEQFCFDVARHLLAPKEHLDAIGVFNVNDPGAIFSKLTEILLLSRPWAARVMLADYGLAKGIAGRWIRGDEGWMPENYSSSASPDLSQRERKKLRGMVFNYLNSGEKPTGIDGIVTMHEKSDKGIFVVITLPRSR
jgi:hypothetical protein